MSPVSGGSNKLKWEQNGMRSTDVALPPLLREGDRLDSGEFLRRGSIFPM